MRKCRLRWEATIAGLRASYKYKSQAARPNRAPATSIRLSLVENLRKPRDSVFHILPVGCPVGETECAVWFLRCFFGRFGSRSISFAGEWRAVEGGCEDDRLSPSTNCQVVLFFCLHGRMSSVKGAFVSGTNYRGFLSLFGSLWSSWEFCTAGVDDIKNNFRYLRTYIPKNWMYFMTFKIKICVICVKWATFFRLIEGPDYFWTKRSWKARGFRGKQFYPLTLFVFGNWVKCIIY